MFKPPWEAKKKILSFFHFLDGEYFLGQKDLEQQASLNAPGCVFLLLSYKLSQKFYFEYLINGKVRCKCPIFLAFSNIAYNCN